MVDVDWEISTIEMAMNRSSSPGTFTKSLNQDETSSQPTKNEAEVDAKIARIRARNEALLKRQAEIEADRRSAEEKLASVTVRSQVFELRFEIYTLTPLFVRNEFQIRITFYV